MPKITQVEPQKKSASRRTKRFNVYLDGEFAFGADEDLVVSQRLIPGKNISPEDLDKLLFEAEVGKLMEKVYNFFSFRMRSEKEVKDWLKVKSLKEKVKSGEGISQLVMDQIVEKLKQKGLINDLEFAKAWVEARRRSKNLGIRVLKSELFQKGIGKEIINELLVHSSLFMDQEEELARQALEKKMKSWKNLQGLEFKKKAIEFLLRHGFEYQTVKKTVENIIKKD